jgi:excisionase family DNA binding protein
METRELYHDKVYTVDEVAAIFRIPSNTVRRLIRRGDLSAIRFGRIYRVPRSVIDDYFDLPQVSFSTEEAGLGMWKDAPDVGDGVEYVNRIRDADTRTLREIVEDLDAC